MQLRDAPNLGVWCTDFVTGKTNWSAEMFLIYGLNAARSTPSIDVLIKYLHVDDRDHVSDTIHQATRSFTPFSFFCRIIRKDRSVRNLFSMGAFHANNMGKKVYRYGVCFDLTGFTPNELAAVKRGMARTKLPDAPVLFALDEKNEAVAKLLKLARTVCKRTRARINSRISEK